MVRMNLILLLSIFYSIVGLAQHVQHVDAEAFNSLIKKNDGVVLDVRTSGEYSRGHIENSTLISISDRDFVKKVSLLQKDKPLYVYCLSGSRSYSVVNYLSKQGYTQLYNLSRGLMDWQQTGYVLVKSTAAKPSASKAYSDEELSAVMQQKSLALLDFYAPWCAPCKKIMPMIDQAQTDFSKTVSVVKVDVEANDKIKTQYGILSIPGLVLIKDGKEVWRHDGVIEKEALYKVIEAYL